jgi:uncharacterized peroxidase-related enzyme
MDAAAPSAATPISRFPVPRLEDLAPDIRARIEAVAEKSGFIPNVFLALAHRPDEFRAFFDYHDALMAKKTGLSRAEREMIVVATSAANNCLYCVIAHGAILRILAKDTEIADRVAINHRKAPLSPRERAMLDYAMKVATNAAAITDTDHATLHDAGFTMDEIWDIGAIAAFFAMSNRLANMSAMQPNPEFFPLGRTKQN